MSDNKRRHESHNNKRKMTQIPVNSSQKPNSFRSIIESDSDENEDEFGNGHGGIISDNDEFVVH